MRIRVVIVAAFVGIAFQAASAAAANGQVPARFFGISPQTELTGADAAYMRAGGIGSVRWPISWGSVQPVEAGGYQWASFDAVVRVTARHRLRVFPFLAGTASWAASDFRTLPVADRKQRRGWSRFVSAAVRRYGPGGGFWREHPALPRLPIRTWQVWNEANFFYFADPISPRRYGRLLKLTSKAIKAVDPRARVILTGLFGAPREKRHRGVSATKFLDALYRVGGIRKSFDGVALHPYAADVSKLKKLVRGMRAITRRNRDGRVPLYITEMGWGSQNDPEVVSFEKGIRGQARELRRAYSFLLHRRKQLRLRAVFWFSWKDMPACNFCDSVGLFYEGAGFVAKPAWRVFVAFTGGKRQPSFEAS